jgi:hypothetical protein
MPAPTSEPHLDAVAVATVAVTALAGGEIAQYAGPYLVIMAAAIVGAVSSLMRRPEVVTRWVALAWVAWLTTLSLLLTGAVSALLEHAIRQAGWEVPSRYLLVPVSLAIAGVGHDWPALLVWAGRALKRLVARKVSQ